MANCSRAKPSRNCRRYLSLCFGGFQPPPKSRVRTSKILKSKILTEALLRGRTVLHRASNFKKYRTDRSTEAGTPTSPAPRVQSFKNILKAKILNAGQPRTDDGHRFYFKTSTRIDFMLVRIKSRILLDSAGGVFILQTAGGSCVFLSILSF